MVYVEVGSNSTAVLTLGETEEFPFHIDSWPDLCYHVYMDGHLVVSTLNLGYRNDKADDM